jgi:hypothetical protein
MSIYVKAALVGVLSFFGIAGLVQLIPTFHNVGEATDETILAHLGLKAFFHYESWAGPLPHRFELPTLYTYLHIRENRTVRQKTHGFGWKPSSEAVTNRLLELFDAGLPDD